MNSFPEPKAPAKCKACGHGDLEIKWLRLFKDIASMTIGNEWVSLEPVPMAVRCTKCGHEVQGQGENFTIDIDKGVILYGYIRTEK